MAYQNFIPTIWSEAINRELERTCVFIENCNRQYEGDVKKMGDTVKILGVSRPTITTTNNKAITLTAPQAIADNAVTMEIKQVAYFNYKVDDIDKRQAVGGLMEALSLETSEGIANAMDKYVAALATSTEAVNYSTATVALTADNILSEIDKAVQKLYESNINANAPITLTVSPRFYILLRRAYAKLDTNNSSVLENGRVGHYGNITIKMSNNVATVASGVEDRIMLRTDRAIAFVNPMIHTEAYRPETSFSDAVKGFSLYDAKIVRPSEMIIMNVKYAG